MRYTPIPFYFSFCVQRKKRLSEGKLHKEQTLAAMFYFIWTAAMKDSISSMGYKALTSIREFTILTPGKIHHVGQAIAASVVHNTLAEGLQNERKLKIAGSGHLPWVAAQRSSGCRWRIQHYGNPLSLCFFLEQEGEADAADTVLIPSMTVHVTYSPLKTICY